MKRYVIASLLIVLVGMLVVVVLTLSLFLDSDTPPARKVAPANETMSQAQTTEEPIAPNQQQETRRSEQAATARSESHAVVTLANGTQVKAELARTPAEQHRGLSGRTSLVEGEGMLFLYPHESTVLGFWMPDMLIALDIIWLNSKFEVVTIKENATPESYPEIFYPTAPAQYVLEVPSGWTAQQGVQVGATFDVLLPEA